MESWQKTQNPGYSMSENSHTPFPQVKLEILRETKFFPSRNPFFLLFAFTLFIPTWWRGVGSCGKQKMPTLLGVTPGQITPTKAWAESRPVFQRWLMENRRSPIRPGAKGEAVPAEAATVQGHPRSMKISQEMQTGKWLNLSSKP